MDLWMQSLTMFQAATVLSSDWPTTEGVDGLFFHARSFGDDDGLFKIAADFHARGARVVINGSCGERQVGTKPGEAWPGKAAYLERLRAVGVADTLSSEPAFNTKQENEMFLKLAVEKKWRSAAILTQPHQMLRAFLGMVKSMATCNYWVRVYAVAPKFTDWCKEVHGSQGAKAMLRFDHIEEEFKRIPLYQQKGDLATFEELFEYLKRRESIR